jgi:hypothetical protein
VTGPATSANKTDFPAGGPPQRIAAADLNRDGKADLVLPITADAWQPVAKVAKTLIRGIDRIDPAYYTVAYGDGHPT